MDKMVPTDRRCGKWHAARYRVIATAPAATEFLGARKGAHKKANKFLPGDEKATKLFDP